MTKNYKLPATIFMVLFSMNVLADTPPSKPKRVGVGIAQQDGASIGVSFLPPDEEGWKTTRKGLSVSLEKDGATAGENRQIEAYMIRLEAPVSPIGDYIKKVKKNIQDSYTSNKDFKVVTLEVTEDANDKRCARIHLLLENLQENPAVATQGRKWSEQYILSCGLLKFPRIGFEVRNYHRYYESHKDAQFAEQADKILDSVILEDK